MYSSSVLVFLSIFAGCACVSPALEEVYRDVVSAVAPGEAHLTGAAARAVFNTLQNRVQCAEVSCEKCSPADAIQQLMTTDHENSTGDSLNISVQDFSFLAAGGVLYLSSPGPVCSAIKQGTWKEETEHFLHDITHSGHPHTGPHDHERVDVQAVELLLQGLHYRPLETQSCVGAGDLTDGHEDGELGVVLGHVLLHVLEGQCFTSLSLPDQSFFLNDIMARLGSDNFSVEELKVLMRNLSLGPEMDHEHDNEHDHEHRRRRRSAQEHTQGRWTNSTWDEHCFSAEELMQIYDLVNSSSSDLARISPALVQQLLSGACSETPTPVNPDKLSQTERYLYATLANAVITIVSMFGIVVLLCTSCTTGFQLSIQFCISLAVGSLTGDALLHLLPMFLGLHVHTAESSSDHEHSHAGEGPPDYVLKMLVVIGGVYYFYLMETLFSLISHRNKRHQHNHHHGDESEPHHCDHGRVLEMYQQEKKQNKKMQSVSKADLVVYEEENPPKKRTREQRLLPYMITIGDSIHNFADGLAMGAAFSVSWKSGVATSIAVLCHELPHELGDFAILLHSGVSIRKALLLNVASAMTSFFGLYIALSLATDLATQQWIAAVTAGLFLYVGLADMLPTLVHIDSKRPWSVFLLQNLGLLSGWAVLLLLSLYEDHISF
ncbi:zinc transporter ZIP4 [Eucyclogobius newberryi]|uniref:zinc transporter ZIP4 n=1 Tax=Eucyclogobius newberryi TaxID=166745 RepID=UPI003B5CAF26